MNIKLYPNAVLHGNIIENGIGGYEDDKPIGITIHYTAGGTATSTIEYLRKTALRYHLLIDRKGSVYQLVYLDDKVNHAGKADWLRHSPNRSHIAIAMANWGTLEKEGDRYLTWTRKSLPSNQVACRPYRGSKKTTYWEACTPEAEESLYRCLHWLCVNCQIKPEHICGHDEATARKVDPGGALSMSIEDLRRSVCAAS